MYKNNNQPSHHLTPPSHKMLLECFLFSWWTLPTRIDLEGNCLSPSTPSGDQSGTANHLVEIGPLELNTEEVGPTNCYWVDFGFSIKISFWRMLIICANMHWAQLSQKSSFGLFLCFLSDEGSGLGILSGFIVAVVFYSLRYFSQALELPFPFSSLLYSPPPHAPPHTSKKPREIDKQQDRGNWAILFLLREPHFAAFIWKLSFSTSLGKSSHRPVTPKCLC